MYLSVIKFNKKMYLKKGYLQVNVVCVLILDQIDFVSRLLRNYWEYVIMNIFVVKMIFLVGDLKKIVD